MHWCASSSLSFFGNSEFKLRQAQDCYMIAVLEETPVANMIKPKFVVLFVLLAVLVAASGRAQTGTSSPTKVTGKPRSTSSGVQYWDITVGAGAAASAGKSVTVHYTGWLAKDGKKFDSSVDKGQPFMFKLGAGQVIKGWDEGVSGMKIGGKLRRSRSRWRHSAQRHAHLRCRTTRGQIIPLGASWPSSRDDVRTS
jgi:hypothetical protein